MKKIYRRLIGNTAVLTMLFTLVTSVPVFASLDRGTSFVHYKTGVEETYVVKDDGTVGLGNGTDAAIPADVTELTIPADVTYFEKWETVHPYSVSSINSNAFLGCDSLQEIFIEGHISVADEGLEGLSENVMFTTGSRKTRLALIAYGIPKDNIVYETISTKYVAFGDSIAAGYVLPEYNGYDDATEQASDGDRFKTPEDAFVALTGKALTEEYGNGVIDNQAVSGWTSQQLLDALETGVFDAALKDADVVTITIGSNDLLGPFMDMVAQALIDEFSTDVLLSPDTEVIETMRQDFGKFGIRIPVRIKKKVEDFITSVGNVAASLNETLADNEVLNAACTEFCENIQPAMVERYSDDEENEEGKDEEVEETKEIVEEEVAEEEVAEEVTTEEPAAE